MKKLGCVTSIGLGLALIAVGLIYEARISRGIEFSDHGVRIGFLGYKARVDVSDTLFISVGYRGTTTFEVRSPSVWDLGGRQIR